MDVSIDLHQPIEVITGLEVCGAHFGEIKLEDFLTENFRGIIIRLVGESKAPPDFARAFITRIRLDGKEYAAFERNRVQNKPAQMPPPPQEEISNPFDILHYPAFGSLTEEEKE